MVRYVLAITFAIFALNNMANAQTDPSSKEEPTKDTLASTVYSLRPIELREGVDADDFEAFVKDEFANAFGKPTHGVRAIIIKGDRGTAKGEYKLVVVFDSKEVRDKYFPIEDGDAAKSLREDATPVQIATVQKLATFVHVGEYTDFVPIGE
ncbi:hypothetical protein CA13_00670 [Planctomycetes bacterium CA13]|uniref:ABM domain-containing protein n=2 Tax=Novipirellula herctigrandis TaxID=2527986 RepID=A0A5C5YV25_9BACT|nr:hypothetical protein CA13_00670 [Planctomycetes bacterium CA13]